MQVIMSMDEYEDMKDQIEEYEKEIDGLNESIDELNKILKFDLVRDMDSGKYVLSYNNHGVKYIPSKYKECTSLTISKSEIINYIKEKYGCEVPKDFEIIIK